MLSITINKKIRAVVLLLVIAFSVCACRANHKAGESIVPSASPTPAPEVVADETDPLLYEGETLYENWVYTFLDINGNNIAERFSFAYVIKNPDDASVITARIAVEFDFARNDKSDTVFIERTSGTLIKPNRIYASQDSVNTIILLEDINALTGQEFYPFVYNSDSNILSEQDSSVQFPENGMSKTKLLDSAGYFVTKKDDSTLSVSYKNEFTTDITVPSDFDMSAYAYSLTFDKSNIVMSYDTQTCLLLFGLSCSVTSDSPDNTGIRKLPFNVMISLKYTESHFNILDISFINK